MIAIFKNNETNDNFYRIVAFLIYTEMVILDLQVENQLRNKNHTADCALGCHLGDNCHVTC